MSQHWSLSDDGGYDETPQPLLLLIRDWIKSGPASLICCCCIEPKLSGVFPKALLGYIHDHVYDSKVKRYLEDRGRPWEGGG